MSEGFDNNYNSPQEGGKGMAIASMVLGIVSIVLCCFWYISLTAVILGIIFAVLSNKKVGKCGMATAGIVCSIIGMIFAIAIIVIAVLGLAALGGMAALEGI